MNIPKSNRLTFSRGRLNLDRKLPQQELNSASFTWEIIPTLWLDETITVAKTFLTNQNADWQTLFRVTPNLSAQCWNSLMETLVFLADIVHNLRWEIKCTLGIYDKTTWQQQSLVGSTKKKMKGRKDFPIQHDDEMFCFIPWVWPCIGGVHSFIECQFN